MSFSRLRLFLVAAALAFATSGCVISIAPPQPPLLGTPAGTVPAAPTSSVTPTSISSALPGASPADTTHVALGVPVFESHTDTSATAFTGLEFHWAKNPGNVHVDLLFDSGRATLVSFKGAEGLNATWSKQADTSTPGFDTRILLDITNVTTDPGLLGGTLAWMEFKLDGKLDPVKIRPVLPREASRQMAVYELVEGGFQPLASNSLGKGDGRLRDSYTQTTPDPTMGKSAPAPTGSDPEVLWQ